MGIQISMAAVGKAEENGYAERLMHILVKKSSDSGNNRPLPRSNRTGQSIVHQVDAMVR
jgi:hypothetical protein